MEAGPGTGGQENVLPYIANNLIDLDRPLNHRIRRRTDAVDMALHQIRQHLAYTALPTDYRNANNHA